MTKAKTIDRLELTRRKFNRPQLHQDGEKLPAPDTGNFTENVNHEEDMRRDGDICPRCGKHTLIHIESCERCTECGYDACAWRDV
ncbi:MAG: hypothetical protein IJG36_11835 [Synergistaceae bacterium]|nr:hypothetical protein [Synergistaceae bacterium]